MALDQELVGRSYPPSAVYEVGRERSPSSPPRSARRPRAPRRGCRPCGRYPDVIAPPTFAIVLTLEAANVVLDDPQVALDYSRVVHGDQRFTHHRPIRAGDRLVATTTIEAVAASPATTCSPTRVDVATEDGEDVCTATSMLVARGTRMSPVRRRRRGRHRAARAGLPVTRADLVRYAGASGDFNPIHWNERVATEVGLPGVIAHGMFTMALAARAVTDLDRRPGRAGGVPVRFGRPVLVPDDGVGAEVTVRGRVAPLLDDDRARVDLTVTSVGRRCSPSRARSSPWHERAAACRRRGRRGAPARRVHLLRRHPRRRGRARAPPRSRRSPPRRPRAVGSPARRSVPSPTPTGRASTSTSTSRTTGGPSPARRR